MSPRDIARQFGRLLDADEFERVAKLLSHDCEYFIGDEVLLGAEAICKSYESNMVEGRQKLDHLEWGESRVEHIDDTGYFVHFTDYLTHKGKKHTHRCRQRLLINEEGLVTRIEHIRDPKEQEKLAQYYKEVGLG